MLKLFCTCIYHKNITHNLILLIEDSCALYMSTPRDRKQVDFFVSLDLMRQHKYLL